MLNHLGTRHGGVHQRVDIQRPLGTLHMLQLRRAQQAGARAVIEVKTIAALRESVALLRETAL